MYKSKKVWSKAEKEIWHFPSNTQLFLFPQEGTINGNINIKTEHQSKEKYSHPETIKYQRLKVWAFVLDHAFF